MDDDRGSGFDPIEIPLEGEGPFQLPLCTDLAAIAIGEALAFLQLETSEGQRVDIPVPIGLLVELSEAVAEALQVATASRDGPMVQ
ncbi:MAG: hypothetical protein JO048_11355 [Methylobacteriaceae bacterium]|nr:hypothetical protein [Methylobacteriaceae bacterium]